MFSYAQTFTYPTVKLADWNHQAITLVKESKEARPKRVSRVKRFRRLGKEDKKSMEKRCESWKYNECFRHTWSMKSTLTSTYSDNHGSVKNGCISNSSYSYLSKPAIFNLHDYGRYGRKSSCMWSCISCTLSQTWGTWENGTRGGYGCVLIGGPGNSGWFSWMWMCLSWILNLWMNEWWMYVQIL